MYEYNYEYIFYFSKHRSNMLIVENLKTAIKSNKKI